MQEVSEIDFTIGDGRRRPGKHGGRGASTARVRCARK